MKHKLNIKNNLIRTGLIILTISAFITTNKHNQVISKVEASVTSSIESKDEIISFSHGGGLYKENFNLEISSNKDGILRYTLDGTDPTKDSTEYTGSIKIYDRTSEENTISSIIIENKGIGRQQQMQPPNFPNENMGENRQDREDRGSPFGGKSVAPEENVFKGTALKVALFSESGELISDILTQSYFVNENIYSKYKLPIISIVTDKENFYNKETGLYTNYNESGSDWERPVHFEFYETDGTLAVSQYMGVRINGNSTRSYQQKSMRLYAKANYDENNKTIKYEIFDGLTKSYNEDILSTFKKIILRNSGNDNSSTMIRDSLIQDLSSDLNVDYQASTPCVAFVNGEFWGIYNIREFYDDHYFANHYDIKRDNISLLEITNTSKTPEIKEGEESDLEHYQKMWDFFNENSMSDNSNYKKAQQYIDIDNLIDYFIANIYSGNTDWPANNNVFWRYKTENGNYDSKAEWYMDGRYRWVLKDMDFGFGFQGQPSSNTLTHAMSEAEGRGVFGKDNFEKVDFEKDVRERGQMGFTNISHLTHTRSEPERRDDFEKDVRERGEMGFTSASSTLIFRSLLENDEFKDKFINRFCDVMNTNYEQQYVLSKIDEYTKRIEHAMEEQVKRYSGAISSIEAWRKNIDKMISYVKERKQYVQGFLQDQFNLNDVTQVTLKTNNQLGYIKINDKKINESSWSGEYFISTTQKITAISLDDSTFSHFIVTDLETNETTQYEQNVINLTIGNKGVVVQAIFE